MVSVKVFILGFFSWWSWAVGDFVWLELESVVAVYGDWMVFGFYYFAAVLQLDPKEEVDLVG